MDINTQSSITEESGILIERTQELQEFASLLPFDNFTLHSNRVYNLWGEKGIGKSTFIASLRESGIAQSNKILWINPHSSESIDTPQEFIAACSKGVRFPKEPDREESISKKLAESQRGKVDPLRSDDAILITRSSVATNRKPYINAAAAASVGRTSFLREDLEVSVGFGANRSGKQAEAFLDALPLKSMGTDLVILYFPETELVSRAVKDWFRDYVIPAATKGPFRRNLIVLTETHQPSEYNILDHSFGEWDEQTIDYCLLPASEDSIYQHASRRGCSAQEARFAFIKSLGYPQTAQDAIGSANKNIRNQDVLSLAATLSSTLPSPEKAKLAACCLPETLYPNELDTLFGYGKGKETISWLASLPGMPIVRASNGSSYSIPDDFRFVAINAVYDDKAFIEFKNRWLPYGRLMHAVPSHADRARLYLLANLNWIEPETCHSLFGDKSDNVSNFIDTNKEYFVKRYQHIRISEHIRQNLRDTAYNTGNPGFASLRKRAEALWIKHRDSLHQTIEELEQSIIVINDQIQALQKKSSLLNSQVKDADDGTRPAFNPQALAIAKTNNNGRLMGLLLTLSLTFFISGFWLDSPNDIISIIGGSLLLCLCLFLIPGWKQQRLANAIKARAKIKGSFENLRKESLELSQQIQADENARDELQRKIAQTNEDLSYSYI